MLPRATLFPPPPRLPRLPRRRLLWAMRVLLVPLVPLVLLVLSARPCAAITPADMEANQRHNPILDDYKDDVPHADQHVSATMRSSTVLMSVMNHIVPRQTSLLSHIRLFDFIYKPGYDHNDAMNPFQWSDYELDPLSLAGGSETDLLVLVDPTHVPDENSLPRLSVLREHALLRSVSRLGLLAGLFVALTAYRYIRLAAFACNFLAAMLSRIEFLGWQYRYEMLSRLVIVDGAFIMKAAIASGFLSLFSVASGMPGNATLTSFAIVHMVTGWYKEEYSMEERLGLLITLPLCLSPIGFGLRQSIAPAFFGISGAFMFMFGVDSFLDTGLWRDALCDSLYGSINCQTESALNRQWEYHFRTATLILMIFCSYVQFYIVWGISKRVPKRRLPRFG